MISHFRACGSFPKPGKTLEKTQSPPDIEIGGMVQSTYQPVVQLIQSFPVLFMSYSVNNSAFCSPPSELILVPYSELDMPLRKDSKMSLKCLVIKEILEFSGN